MKHLTIIRHAKAEDPANFADDALRPLTEKGRKDARATARVVSNLQPGVDWWIASPALRSRESCEILLAALDLEDEIHYDEDIYLAPPERLMAILALTPLNSEHVALIGHNPGLEELIAGLCAGGALNLNFRLPTAALAHIELELSRWDQMRWGCGQLRMLVSPKLLKK